MKLVRNYPALLLEEEHRRILVVADLHIGWEGALAEKGIYLPSQTPRLMKKILRLVRSCRPTGLVFVGDVKHTIAKVKTEEWQRIPDLFEILGKRVSDIWVIPGNHDGGLEAVLPTNVKLMPTKGIAIGDVAVFHGHAWPAPELLVCQTLVTGHVHPVVALRDPLGFRITRQVWVKAKCDRKRFAKSLLRYLGAKADTDPVSSLEQRFDMTVRAKNFFIMPSFNDFLGGQPVNRKKGGSDTGARFIGPILRSESVNIDDAELFLLDGTFIGTVEQLRGSA